MTTRTPRAVLVLALLTAVLGACSDSTPRSSATEDTIAPGSLEKYCALSSQLFDSRKEDTPEGTRATFEKVDALLPDLVAKAPREIRSDVTRWVAGFRQLRDAYEAVGYNVAELQAQPTILSNDRYLRSMANVSSYDAKHCDVK